MTQLYRSTGFLISTASKGRSRAVTMLAAGVLLLAASRTGHAQSEPAPPTATVTVETAPAPLPPAPPPPSAAAPADALPPLSVSAWGRLGLVLQGADGDSLDDLSENGEVNLILGGKIHKNFSIAADIAAVFGPTGGGGDITGALSILDLIAQMEFHDLFNVWVGRMLVPSDRSNFSGPWFMSPWNYPGSFAGFFAAPHQGPSGRNDGVTVWGQADGGKYKYYAGAFDLFNVGLSPLFTGRVNIALMDPEPGYLHSSSYYGKEMLTFGLGGQFQHNGSVAMGAPDADFSEVNADVLYEHTLGNKAVLDIEGAVYGYFGDNEAISSSFFVLASYLFPDKLGIGQLQPVLRFQGATQKGGGDFATTIEAQLGYIVIPYAARLALVYQRSDTGDVSANAITFGVQLQK